MKEKIEEEPEARKFLKQDLLSRTGARFIKSGWRREGFDFEQELEKRLPDGFKRNDVICFLGNDGFWYVKSKKYVDPSSDWSAV